MKLAICVATMRSEDFPGEIWGWIDNSQGPESVALYVQRNTSEQNLGIVGSYQNLYGESQEDILCYLHDDVVCREEGWDKRVLQEFEDPTVGIVGFGGAIGHGSPDLYKVPYRLQDLQRYDYRSNVDDAEVHGERFEGACDAAVLDGFALCIRRSFLDRIGGWPVNTDVDFIGYDYWICCMARRYGYRIRLCGVRCHHFGGRTSVSKATQKYTGQEAYDKAHKAIYETFRDVLPYKT